MNSEPQVLRLLVQLTCRVWLLVSKWPYFFFFWKLELRSLVTFCLQANIYSRAGNWQEGGFKMKMLPNWSLHLSETHGVTMDRVLRTQNICQSVELEEPKLFPLLMWTLKITFCACVVVAISTYLFGFSLVMELEPFAFFFVFYSGQGRLPEG